MSATSTGFDWDDWFEMMESTGLAIDMRDLSIVRVNETDECISDLPGVETSGRGAAPPAPG
jgi:hypothetical protein